MRKKAVILFLLRIAKIALGILNLSIAAKYFGVSVGRDIWILAFNSMIILDMAIWGPINETFRAKFISLRELSGEEAAIRKTKSLLIFTMLLSAIFVISVMIYPNPVAKLIAPSYKGAELDALLKMLIYVAPCFFVNQLIQILISLLNAYESFYIPEISSFISAGLNLILIIFLAPYMGIYSLLIAYYLGVVILFIMVQIQIRKLKIPIFTGFAGVKRNDFYVFIIFALPFFFPYFLGQISAIVEKTMASSLNNGSVSMIDYSRKFTEMLMGVLSSILYTILVPILSVKFAQKKPKEFVVEFIKIYQLGFLAITLMICMFTACPDAFVNILYNKGSISHESLAEISRLTMFYSWGVLSVYLYLIFGIALLSAGNGKKYAFWGVMAQVMTIIINISLIKFMGIYIFPLATFVSHLLIGTVMFFSFPYKNKKLFIVTIKYLVILLLTVSSMYMFNKHGLSVVYPVTKIIVNTLILVTLLLIQVFAFRLDERSLLIDKFNKIFYRKDG